MSCEVAVGGGRWPVFVVGDGGLNLERKKKNNKKSQTHIQIIVRVFQAKGIGMVH
jgi:hypothetical protein